MKARLGDGSFEGSAELHRSNQMDKKQSMPPMADETEIHYEIKVKGHLAEHWSEWLGGLRITHDAQGNSRLTGVVPDQAALHGILAQIRDMGLTLISLTPQCVGGEEEEESADERRNGNTV